MGVEEAALVDVATGDVLCTEPVVSYVEVTCVAVEVAAGVLECGRTANPDSAERKERLNAVWGS